MKIKIKRKWIECYLIFLALFGIVILIGLTIFAVIGNNLTLLIIIVLCLLYVLVASKVIEVEE
jgi:hypothetical protein